MRNNSALTPREHVQSVSEEFNSDNDACECGAHIAAKVSKTYITA